MAQTPLETITGRVERVTYTNPENGFTVARIKVKGRSDLVTILGNFPEPIPGEELEVSGWWRMHPKYGEQFQVQTYKSRAPATVHGIRKYLASGMVKGVGPVMAERIVSKFGKKTLGIIENEPERLCEIEGIGPKRVEMIRESWAAQKEIQNVMLFLQSHGVSIAYAVKIYKTYGEESINVVSEDPYRLADDIYGIGFLTADKIAKNLGIPEDSPQRLKAGINYVLNKAADDGHVFLPYSDLVARSKEILNTGEEEICRAIDEAYAEKRIIMEDICQADAGEGGDPGVCKAVYPVPMHVCESGIARILFRLMSIPRSFGQGVDPDEAIAWVTRELHIRLAEKQKEAIAACLKSKLLVITGGPGTGKTTIIRAILMLAKRLSAQVKLAAPTGRAAKRMNETTMHPAMTIHRMLSFDFEAGGFQKNEKNPIEADLFIIDEASMIDTWLMYHLLKAVPSGATLVLVGDVNQLPSVGPGNVLSDIIDSGCAKVVRLTEIFRQAQKSRIVVTAHSINQGRMPRFGNHEPECDCFFVAKEDPEDVLSTIIDLACDRIPARFGFDPLSDIQVLAPMHRGILGTGNFNLRLQERLNPGAGGIKAGGWTYRVGDKVMQVKNNYTKDVYNGDIGRVASIDTESREVIIEFDSRPVHYDVIELDEISPAYAVTVHKAQGSEFPAVIIPVVTQHYMMLQRNLVYTAVTRGRMLVVMVGTKKALAIAVKNNKQANRYSRLAFRLKTLCESGTAPGLSGDASVF